MRLINCRDDSLRMQEFIGRPPFPFAILSHTWNEEEVSLQAFNDIATRIAAKGWSKIEQTCREARRGGFDYVWIDSCCIDETNNAELSKSINSMFQWYSEAGLCLVYLGRQSNLRIQARAKHANAMGSDLAAVYVSIPGINTPVQSKRYMGVKLLEAEPRELWDSQNNVFVTSGLRSFTAFLKFYIRGFATG